MKYNKYGNKKVRIGGDEFDSQKEYHRWCELLLLERAGKIRDLQRQVRFELIPAQHALVDGKPKKVEHAVHYVADFVYWLGDERIVEDAKGAKTREYVLKRKLMLFRHGIRVREV